MAEFDTILFLYDPCRNFRQTCDQISGLDLSSWKSEDDSTSTEALEDIEPITTPAPFLDELNPELINAAVNRAKESLSERRRFEYEAWLARKFLFRFNGNYSLF